MDLFRDLPDPPPEWLSSEENQSAMLLNREFPTNQRELFDKQSRQLQTPFNPTNTYPPLIGQTHNGMVVPTGMFSNSYEHSITGTTGPILMDPPISQVELQSVSVRNNIKENDNIVINQNIKEETKEEIKEEIPKPNSKYNAFNDWPHEDWNWLSWFKATDFKVHCILSKANNLYDVHFPPGAVIKNVRILKSPEGYDYEGVVPMNSKGVLQNGWTWEPNSCLRSDNKIEIVGTSFSRGNKMREEKLTIFVFEAVDKTNSKYYHPFYIVSDNRKIPDLQKMLYQRQEKVKKMKINQKRKSDQISATEMGENSNGIIMSSLEPHKQQFLQEFSGFSPNLNFPNFDENNNNNNNNSNLIGFPENNNQSLLEPPKKRRKKTREFAVDDNMLEKFSKHKDLFSDNESGTQNLTFGLISGDDSSILVSSKVSRFTSDAGRKLSVQEWSDIQIEQWLERIGLGMYSGQFTQHGIDTGDLLLELDSNQIAQLIWRIGHQIQFKRELEKLKSLQNQADQGVGQSLKFFKDFINNYSTTRFLKKVPGETPQGERVRYLEWRLFALTSREGSVQRIQNRVEEVSELLNANTPNQLIPAPNLQFLSTTRNDGDVQRDIFPMN